MSKTTEIATKENVLPVIQNPRTILDVIGSAVADPNTDTAKMSELLVIYERILAIEREKVFNSSLATLQAEMPRIPKHGKVDYTTAKGRTNYAYERYEDIDVITRPLLTQHGFSYVFIQMEAPSNRFKGTILHKDGHSMSGYFTAEPDKSGGKNDIQAGGSTWSYIRRYIFKGLLNIVTIGEDDDAQSFSYITTVQVAELKSLLEKYEINLELFLKQFGVESLSVIAASQFETIVRAIDKRNANKAMKAEVIV
jgi:hypothetical protein